MFAPAQDKVLDVDLDDLLAAGGLRDRAAQVSAVMGAHRLSVDLVVLCHGDDPVRWETAARLCRSLSVLCENDDRVRLTVSHQGGRAPAALTARLDPHVRIMDAYPPLVHRPAGALVPAEGKTEHLLSCLAAMAAEGGDPDRRFAVFLDNDYLVYDAENAFALYAPWVLGFSSDGKPCQDAGFAGVRFAKGGSMRLAVHAELAKPGGERTWGFMDLLDAALALRVPLAPPVSERMPARAVPTRTTLLRALGSEAYAELEAALEQVTKHGGRSSRALSLWLSSRRDRLVEHWLGRFSFLLHGDQGATLAAWTAMELAPGYGLEISFLINALFRPGLHTGRIVNALTLPHAHLPKAEADNFAMGVEMFTLVQHLLHGMTSRDPDHRPGPPVQQRWAHQSPTKLGYKTVLLTTAGPRTPALYPPVTELTQEGPS